MGAEDSEVVKYLGPRIGLTVTMLFVRNWGSDLGPLTASWRGTWSIATNRSKPQILRRNVLDEEPCSNDDSRLCRSRCGAARLHSGCSVKRYAAETGCQSVAG